MKYAILILMFVLAACTADQAPVNRVTPQEPGAPVDEAVPEGEQKNTMSGDGTVIVQSGTDKTFGEVDRNTAVDLESVKCDREARSITFSFKNDDVKNWQMNQEVPFPAPKDLAAVRVYLNSYEVNGRNPYLKDGERMFGPEERFSDNCGGIELLEPGQVATCTLSPVPLKSANEFIAGNNEILVHSPTSKQILQFTC